MPTIRGITFFWDLKAARAIWDVLKCDTKKPVTLTIFAACKSELILMISGVLESWSLTLSDLAGRAYTYTIGSVDMGLGTEHSYNRIFSYQYY